MNIFLLDKDPARAAQSLCDAHVVKMCLEYAQLLCGAHEPGYAPYKRTHYNHPCSRWVRRSFRNYFFLCDLAIAVCDEYRHRFGKRHKSQGVIEWCEEHIPKSLPDEELELPPAVVPENLKCGHVIIAYRMYYLQKKETMKKFQYTNRKRPCWLDYLNCVK